MSVIATAIKFMKAGGMSDADILTAVIALEAEVEDMRSPYEMPRSPGAIRTARWRENKTRKEAETVTGDVTVTSQGNVSAPPCSNTPPVKKDSASEARASSADASASDDPRQRLFSAGREALQKLTGKTPDSCKSLIGRWLKVVDDEAIHVLAAIDDACRGPPADPTAWITARLQSLKRTEALNGRGRQPVAPGGKGNSPITGAIDALIGRLSSPEPGGGDGGEGSARLLPFRRGE